MLSIVVVVMQYWYSIIFVRLKSGPRVALPCRAGLGARVGSESPDGGGRRRRRSCPGPEAAPENRCGAAAASGPGGRQTPFVGVQIAGVAANPQGW